MSARLESAVERAAMASREVAARSVRPGWWIFSFGQWSEVVSVATGRVPRGEVRFELRHRDGRHGLVEASPSNPTSYLTAATARRVGLVGGGR